MTLTIAKQRMNNNPPPPSVNYNVYKVETINDSYMVASGLPERNGDQHAAEIANLAIALQSITPTIVVPHDTSRRLQIKMGIHTGATIAGVGACIYCILHIAYIAY